MIPTSFISRSQPLWLKSLNIHKLIFPTHICCFIIIIIIIIIIETIRTQTAARTSSVRSFYIVLYTFVIVKFYKFSMAPAAASHIGSHITNVFALLRTLFCNVCRVAVFLG